MPHLLQPRSKLAASLKIRHLLDISSYLNVTKLTGIWNKYTNNKTMKKKKKTGNFGIYQKIYHIGGFIYYFLGKKYSIHIKIFDLKIVNSLRLSVKLRNSFKRLIWNTDFTKLTKTVVNLSSYYTITMDIELRVSMLQVCNARFFIKT